MSHKLFIIAGEASGDIYGAYLIRLLKEQHPTVSIKAWGGDQMKRAGADIGQHISELSIMGFVEVFKNLARLQKLFKRCQDQILEFETDTVVFVDFPGFNLRLAPWAKDKGIRTVQYISPKVWAWKESRLQTIRKYIDELVCIFPFEIEYYKQHAIKAHYYGNPLHKIIQNHKANLITNEAGKDIVALFPGSRKQEIRRILPRLIAFATKNPTYHFTIGGMSIIGESFYNTIIMSNPLRDNISIVMDRNYDILESCVLAINTSGTITLETAIFGKAQIAVYRTHPVSYELIKRLIKVNYISLPNILSGQKLIPELIQGHFTLDKLQLEFNRLVNTSEDGYTEFVESLKLRNEKKLVELLMSGGKKKRLLKLN